MLMLWHERYKLRGTFCFRLLVLGGVAAQHDTANVCMTAKVC